MLCTHLRVTLDQMTSEGSLEYRSGLPHAQCRHLGAWLRPGGPLAGVKRLRFRQGTVDLEADAWDLSSCGVDAKLMIVLALPLAASRILTTLWLGNNKIGDHGYYDER